MEAQGFRDELKRFTQAGVAVVGASADSPAANEKFRTKHNLPYPLLCDDESKSLCHAFGVWQQKKMAGRTYMGIVRASFLVDGDGVVIRTYAKVKTAVHAEEVLSDLV